MRFAATSAGTCTIMTVRDKEGVEMQKCKQCQKTYDIKETKRIFGDVWWANIYCCAQCYTKSCIANVSQPKICQHGYLGKCPVCSYYE